MQCDELQNLIELLVQHQNGEISFGYVAQELSISRFELERAFRLMKVPVGELQL